MLPETAADVVALIPRHAWLLMSEDQRDALMRDVVLPRYMETTADGVALGPTWWAQAVGASSGAIQKRVERLRQSQTRTEDTATSTPSEQAARRHARAVLREAEPEVVERIVADLPPERQQLVAAAVQRALPPPPVVPSGAGPTIGELETELGPTDLPPSRRRLLYSAATAVHELHAAMERYSGLEDADGLTLERDRRTAETMRDQALEIAAAISEQLTERSLR